MPPAQSLRLIERLTRRRPRARRAPEPADMGTCFGMEQCLDERAAAPVAAPVAGDKPASRAWLPRWWQPAAGR